jgi:pimeloyl-ACP methyl ester carboxylesterase
MLERLSVVVGAARVWYIEREASGDGAKAPILLLHGLIATAAMFEALIAELPTDRRVVALDLPGTGERDVSFEGLARVVRDLCGEIGLVRPVILGHSHGGAIALRVAASFRDFPEALILLSPAHPFMKRDRLLVRFFMSPPGRMFARAMPLFPRFMQEFAFRRMLGPVGRKRGVNFEAYRKRLCERGVVSLVLRMVENWTSDMRVLGDDLQREIIRTPALFLWGDCDRVVPLSTAPELQRHIRMWEQSTLRDVGHLSNEEAPEKCGSLIRTWLIRLETHPKYLRIDESMAAGETVRARPERIDG